MCPGLRPVPGTPVPILIIDISIYIDIPDIISGYPVPVLLLLQQHHVQALRRLGCRWPWLGLAMYPGVRPVPAQLYCYHSSSCYV